MATNFVIACPDCGKQVKVSDEHVGKRVKCKECGTVYPVKAPAGAPTATKGPPPPPAKPKAKATQAKAGPGKPSPTKAEASPPADGPAGGYKFEGEEEDEDAGPKQYSLEQTNDSIARCPFCAQEMESNEARICLNCGYNTRTRMRPQIEQVYQNSFGKVFLWLLPGILCVLTMIGLLVWYIIFWMRIEVWMADSWFEDEPGPPKTYLIGLGPGFCRLYLALITAAIYVPLVRFSYRRLIKNNKPQEQKIKDDWDR
jgi:DNA-directed RNA polymerase subunit M/transcription elongation factor TFIIS